MANELQEMRDQLLQLRAENERLHERLSNRQTPSDPGASNSDSTSSHDFVSPSHVERLVYIPRERKCPSFRGTAGITVEDWVEEMRATLRTRHLKPIDQAYFIYDHLEGEAKDEIRYRPRAEREDPEKMFNILQDMYGCSKSYVSLQQAFFSRRQLEGESLQEFSHALCCLMEKVERSAPGQMPDARNLLRDQFVEYVRDANLRRELKKLVRENPTHTLIDVRAEAIRWEREGRSEEPRGRSYSVPSFSSAHYSTRTASTSINSEFKELRHMLEKQQEQLNQLTQGLLALQTTTRPLGRNGRPNAIICLRCQKPGHIARECDNERVPSQPRPSQVAARTSAQEAGNSPPLM